MVTHAPPGDTFWDLIRKGAEMACADYEIPLHGAHCALNDARATAHLLLRVAEAFEGCRPAVAYPLSGDVPRVLTRDGFTAVDIERPYVLHLACSLHSPADVAPYVTLLDYAVADLKFDADERREAETSCRGPRPKRTQPCTSAQRIPPFILAGTGGSVAVLAESADEMAMCGGNFRQWFVG